MDLHLILGVASGSVGVISIIPYVVDIFYGTTRPNVVTAAVWTLIQGIVVVAQWSAGASWSIILPAALCFNTFLVLMICLAGYGYKRYGKSDIICFSLAILSIILWQVTSDPIIGLAFAIIADAFGTWPTLVKTWREPLSESVLAWVLSAIASALAVASTAIFNFANLSYPIYFVIVDLTVIILALRRF
jgi:hypothetical protein